MRVFSKASVLLTFMSQARFSSGSQILTIGTLADETHTTFCMPSIHRLSVEALSWVIQERSVRLLRRSAIKHTLSNSFHPVVMQMSTVDKKG